jgi:L-aspartate oxidase
MTRCAGVLRSAASLDEARHMIDAVAAAGAALERSPATYELVNLVTVARAVLDAAVVREESRGCHTRDDFPETRDSFRVRLVL